MSKKSKRRAKKAAQKRRQWLTQHGPTDAIFLHMGMDPPTADEWRALAFATCGSLCTHLNVPDQMGTTFKLMLREMREGGGPPWLPPWQKRNGDDRHPRPRPTKS